MTKRKTTNAPILAQEVSGWFSKAVKQSNAKSSPYLPNPTECGPLAAYLEGLRTGKKHSQLWTELEGITLNTALPEAGRKFLRELSSAIDRLKDDQDIIEELRKSKPPLALQDERREIEALERLSKAIVGCKPFWDFEMKRGAPRKEWHSHAARIRKLIDQIYEAANQRLPKFYKGGFAVSVIQEALRRATSINVESESIVRTFERENSRRRGPRH